MKSLARWSTNNRVTINLLMIFVILAGLLSLTRMRREMFPQFSLDFIQRPLGSRPLGSQDPWGQRPLGSKTLGVKPQNRK